jgi:hypothetical protein
MIMMKTVKGNFMRHSDTYIATIDRNDLDHAELLRDLKLITKIYQNRSDFDYRVQIVGRLGKNNPNADKYKNNVYKRYHAYGKIRIDDAAHYDIYVYNRDKTYDHDYKRQYDELKALAATLRSYANKSLAYKTL